MAARRPSANPRRRRLPDAAFLNVPYDAQHEELFLAFLAGLSGFALIPHATLEIPGSQRRLDRIFHLLRRCRYSFHDLSRVEVDPTPPATPRFNMPFELGLDIGCRVYGPNETRKKKCLVLDSDPYRYKSFLSDISGQDIRSHRNSPATAINLVRQWLRVVTKRESIPGPLAINEKFARFTNELPRICDEGGLARNDLQFVEYVTLVEAWLRTEK